MLCILDLKPGETAFAQIDAAIVIENAPRQDRDSKSQTKYFDTWLNRNREIRRPGHDLGADFDLRLVRHPNGLIYVDFRDCKESPFFCIPDLKTAAYFQAGGELVPPGAIAKARRDAQPAFREEGKSYVGDLAVDERGFMRAGECWRWNNRFWIDGYSEVVSRPTKERRVYVQRSANGVYVLFAEPVAFWNVGTWPDIGPQFPIEIHHLS